MVRAAVLAGALVLCPAAAFAEDPVTLHLRKGQAAPSDGMFYNFTSYKALVQDYIERVDAGKRVLEEKKLCEVDLAKARASNAAKLAEMAQRRMEAERVLLEHRAAWQAYTDERARYTAELEKRLAQPAPFYRSPWFGAGAGALLTGALFAGAILLTR